MKHFVVIGGGFAGIEAAIKLRKYGYEVTLISNRDYLFVYPISIWIPTAKKSFEQVQIKLENLSEKHGFNLIIDEIKKINYEENLIRLSDKNIEYDYLFLAMGMDKMQNNGIEHTNSICGKPKESIVIREKLSKLVEQGFGRISVGFGSNPKDSTATAVRGGPAFELLFNISHYLKQKGVRDKFELNFFAPMQEPGKKMGEKAYSKLAIFFKRYRVKTYIGKKIAQFRESAVVFEDNSVLESDLIIFIPGGSGHKLIKESNIPQNEAGFVKINHLCQVEGKPNVYAIGDIAELVGPKWAAKQGHIAEVMADVAAYNVHNELIGKEKRKSYTEKLNIVCVMDSGDGAAFISRNQKRDFIIPLPIIGHWLKRAWGFYYINSKLKRIPRIPGM